MEELVDVLKRRAERRRTDHASMQHARHAEVVHIGKFSGQLFRNVTTRGRFADELVIARAFRRRRRVDFQHEIFAADQILIGDPRAARFRSDNTFVNRKIVLCHVQTLSGLIQESVSRCGGSLTNLHAPSLDGLASIGRPLIWRERRIAGHEADIRKPHIEFFCDDLGKSDIDAGSEVNLPGVKRHHALVVDGEERIDLIETDRLCRRGGVLGQRVHVWRE